MGLLLSACAPAADNAADSAATATADPATVRAAIEAQTAKVTEAIIKGDIESVLNVYTADAVVMQPNQTAWRGTEAIRGGFQGMLAVFTPSAVAFHTDDVQVAGDLAIETGRYEMTLTPKKGAAINDKGKYVTVWQRQTDGSWKVIRDINNTDLPAPTG